MKTVVNYLESYSLRGMIGSVMVRALDLQSTSHGFDSLSCNDPGQVVHTHVPLSPKQCNLVPAKWQ